jgi:uncharacterized protein (DUF736 family)
MPVIGTFQAVKDGYTGSIRTLMLNGRVRILANDRKNSDGAPDFRISLGMTEIGAASDPRGRCRARGPPRGSPTSRSSSAPWS